jgi:hypothetical protein
MVTLPAVTPVTTPDASTVATDAVPLLHTPPPIASARVRVAPAQTVLPPVMLPAVGVALTVTAAVVVALPQLLLTV